MADLSQTIHDVLPTELLQRILLLSAPTLIDLLRISTTCSAWRKVIFNEFILQQYFKFDEKHRRQGLVKWWNFNQQIDNPLDNPFLPFSLTDCFLGKSVIIADLDIDVENGIKTEFPLAINRGENFSIAFWFYLEDLIQNGLFLVSDDDWDYRRSSGFGLDENQYFSIMFLSTISYRAVPSSVKAQSKVWYSAVLVQERTSDSETPEQKLWINGQLVLKTSVPIAAYAEEALFTFFNLRGGSHYLADISIWSRCLAPREIEAIYEQKTSIDRVDVSRYILQHLRS